jgi:hypothetical protein
MQTLTEYAGQPPRQHRQPFLQHTLASHRLMPGGHQSPGSPGDWTGVIRRSLAKAGPVACVAGNAWPGRLCQATRRIPRTRQNAVVRTGDHARFFCLFVFMRHALENDARQRGRASSNQSRKCPIGGAGGGGAFQRFVPANAAAAASSVDATSAARGHRPARIPHTATNSPLSRTRVPSISRLASL